MLLEYRQMSTQLERLTGDVLLRALAGDQDAVAELQWRQEERIGRMAAKATEAGLAVRGSLESLPL